MTKKPRSSHKGCSFLFIIVGINMESKVNLDVEIESFDNTTE